MGEVVRDATATVAMGYVTVIDAATQTMHDLAQISGQIAMRSTNSSNNGVNEKAED